MRYGYDFNNPVELKMFLDKKQRDFERSNDNTKTIQEKYVDFVKEQQKEFEYFYNRDKMEKAAAAAAEKQIEEQIEKELPQLLEKALNDLLKDFK